MQFFLLKPCKNDRSNIQQTTCTERLISVEIKKLTIEVLEEFKPVALENYELENRQKKQ